MTGTAYQLNQRDIPAVTYGSIEQKIAGGQKDSPTPFSDTDMKIQDVFLSDLLVTDEISCYRLSVNSYKQARWVAIGAIVGGITLIACFVAMAVLNVREGKDPLQNNLQGFGNGVLFCGFGIGIYHVLLSTQAVYKQSETNIFVET